MTPSRLPSAHELASHISHAVQARKAATPGSAVTELLDRGRTKFGEPFSPAAAFPLKKRDKLTPPTQSYAKSETHLPALIVLKTDVNFLGGRLGAVFVAQPARLMELRETRVRPGEVDGVSVQFVRMSIVRTQTSCALLLGGGRFEYFLLEKLLHGSRERPPTKNASRVEKGKGEKAQLRPITTT